METNGLCSALAKAQAEMKPAQKTGYNPHFKSSFSTLEDLIEASRLVLTKNGLSVCQYPHSEGENTYLVTKLKHASGQEELSMVRIVLKDPSDIQKLGSALSYLKRYAYASMCGIATSEGEDDGEYSRTEQVDNKSSDAVSPKQLGLLRMKINGNVELEKKICAHYQINSLEMLPWKKMNEVMALFEGK